MQTWNGFSSLSLFLSLPLSLSPLYYLFSPLQIWAAQQIFMRCHRGVCEEHRRGPWEVMCNLESPALKGEGDSEMPPSEASSYSLLLSAFSFRVAWLEVFWCSDSWGRCSGLGSEWREKAHRTPAWCCYLVVSHSISEAGLQPPGHLCQSALAAVTKYHRLRGLNNGHQFSHSLEPGSPRSRCQQVWPLSLAYRRPPSRCVLR